MTTDKQAPLAGIEANLIQATRNDALGWETVDVADIGQECMSGYGRFDWQASVPELVRRLWADLPLSARLVAYLCARQIAHFDEPTDD